MSENHGIDDDLKIRPLIKQTKRPEIQAKLDEELTKIEDSNLGKTTSKIGFNLLLGEEQARINVAREIMKERSQARLEKEATTDKLTGLLNMRGVDKEMNKALEVMKRDGGQMVAVEMDLDGLKRENDTNGHESGNNLIRNAARALKEAGKITNINARHGGDEFRKLIVNPTEGEVKATLDHLAYGLHARNITASVGVAYLDPLRPEEGLAMADGAQYKSKSLKGDGKSHFHIENSETGDYENYEPTPIQPLQIHQQEKAA